MIKYLKFAIFFPSILVITTIHGKVVLKENFDTNVLESKKWIKSHQDKYQDQPVLILPGPNPVPGYENDKGIQLTQEMKHYGFGSKFSEPLQVKDTDFVIQYEVKFVDTLSCGGAYVKLIRDDIDLTELKDSTPYTIMFGPDRCGTNNKVHFILQHQNPISKDWEEKHATNVPAIKTDKQSHLYTLSVKKDNTYEIFIDKNSEKKGNLLTDLEPPVNPPAEIDDPEDHKPEDWEDNAQIVDETARKPDDWDESQPATIPDKNAVKPSGWLEDEPQLIPDPDAKKPNDWDEEQDGEYEPLKVPNPKCEAAGCGKWTPPRIGNPLYKGKWRAPMIDNPKYKGVWAARKIPNPNYYLDNKPSDLATMYGLVIEVWTTNAGIHFDNFFVGTSLSEAFNYADETFVKKSQLEIAREKEEIKKEKEKAKKDKIEKEGWKGYLETLAEDIIQIVQDNKIAVGSCFAVLAATLIYLLLTSPSEPTTQAETPENTPNSGLDSPDEDHAEEKKPNSKESPNARRPTTPVAVEQAEDDDAPTKSNRRSKRITSPQK